MGADGPKQFLDLGDGTRMINRSLDALADCPLVEEIVVAIPAGGWPEEIRKGSTKPLTLVAGGSRRQDSVANALARVSDAADLIVIHDAARPFVTAETIERTIRAAEQYGAAIAAVAVNDTVKQAEGGVIRRTLPRESIFLAQTPQAFKRDVLAHALAAAGDTTVTDEAMLVERLGFSVHLVQGDPGNLKVTTPDDLANARRRLRNPEGAGAIARVGTGYDLHRLVAGRPLILAGVHIPFELGLDGHSDADIVCHAITDAVLGAAAAGDIGRMFPDTEPQWKDADSMQLLRGAMEVVRLAGYAVANVDVTVIAERPKLVGYLDAMRMNLAAALGVQRTDVSIKGKTNEKVGAVGRGEAMACHAVVLLR
jgi:2-C-methyl-D-erythritol 4-phosphate cytidylyltransferase/2-C-methyl-D-erythritol 2,4-cyclodiphosphate synthase